MVANSSFIPALEGLRGWAFLLVLFAHLSVFFHFPFQTTGKEGLILFFVLSAFLLTRNLVEAIVQNNHKRMWSRYAFRRLLRIYPMYICTLVLLLVLRPLPEPFSLTQVVNHLLLFDGRMHLWSIPVEMKYYFLLPFVVLVFVYLCKKRLRLFSRLVCLLLIIYALGYPLLALVTKQGLTNEISIWLYFPTFILGTEIALVSLYYLRITDVLEKYSDRLVILCLVALVIITPLTVQPLMLPVYDRVFYAVFLYYTIIYGLLILVLGLTKPRMGILFTNKIVRFIGKISFSAYLLHYLLLQIWQAHQISLSPILGSLVIAGGTLCLATFTYFLVERPFIALSRRW